MLPTKLETKFLDLRNAKKRLIDRVQPANKQGGSSLLLPFAAAPPASAVAPAPTPAAAPLVVVSISVPVPVPAFLAAVIVRSFRLPGADLSRGLADTSTQGIIHIYREVRAEKNNKKREKKLGCELDKTGGGGRVCSSFGPDHV